MYSIITINKTEYKFEFSIEASLHSDCVTSIADLFSKLETSESEDKLSSVIYGIANIPYTALTLFHSGLMEHHPDITFDMAKSIAKAFLEERKGTEDGNFYGLLNLCIKQMEEDGFFDLIGMTTLLAQEEPEEKNNKPKTTKKTAKVSDK